MNKLELINFSVFEKITNFFTVKDIARSDIVFPADADKIIEELPDYSITTPSRFGNIENWVCIVMKDGVVKGYVHPSNNPPFQFSDDDDDDFIYNTWGEVMEPIPIEKIISHDTSLLELISLFEKIDDYFLVMNKNEITSIVNFYDLDCNEVKLCLFSLISELDDLLNKFIHLRKINVKDFMTSEIIEKRTKEKRENDKLYGLRPFVHYLNLSDKLKILKENKIKLFENSKKESSFTKTLTDVRNKIAHFETIIGYEFIKFGKAKKKFDAGFVVEKAMRKQEYYLKDPKKLKNFIYILTSTNNKLKEMLNG